MTANVLFHQCPLCVFKIEPSPVSGLHLALLGFTQATLTWKNANGTATCRLLLESIGSSKDLTQDSVVNISGLIPGTRNKFTLSFSDPNEQRESSVINSSLGEFTKVCFLSALLALPFSNIIVWRNIILLFVQDFRIYREGFPSHFGATLHLYEEGGVCSSFTGQIIGVQNGNGGWNFLSLASQRGAGPFSFMNFQQNE